MDKIKAFLTSPAFSVLMLLAVVAYYVFRLKRFPTIEEAFTQTALILVRLGTLIDAATKAVSPKAVSPKAPAPPAPGAAP